MSIEAALSYIPPDPRERWVEMAMALKSELGDGGYDLWDRWSRQSDRYQAAAAKAVWRSIRGHGITIRSLYKQAREFGWKGEETAPAAPPRDSARRQASEARELEIARQKAASKALWILQQTTLERHPYLAAKGFAETDGLVWTKDQPLLVVPMRAAGKVVNVQLINPVGEKKFLAGGQAGGAEHVVGNGGIDILCEGYATGLSVQAAIQALRMRARVHVCFSAQNMVRIARGLRRGITVADHDASGTGERMAREIGWPYWMAPVVGDDANDHARRVGLFKFSQSLRRVLVTSK